MDYYSDDEAYDLSGFQTITLFDYEPPTTTGAKLKFDIEGTDFHYDEDGDSQPDGIVDEDIGDGALSIKCDVIKVVNGTLSQDGPPATLIVFQFAFLPHGNNHRFKTVEITITFSSGKVHSISPDNEWTTLPSEKVQERTHTVSPSIEAAFGPAKAATTYTWQRKETQTIRGYAKVTGEIKSMGQSHGLGMRRKKKNTVMWGLYEDVQAPTGIPSLLESAVLVEREATDTEPFGERFSATIRIHGNVDRAARIKDKMEQVEKWMSGGTRKGRDIRFHPHPRTNRGTAVHPDRLEDEDLDTYRQLIAIRAWGATPTQQPGKTQDVKGGVVANQVGGPAPAPADVGGQDSSTGPPSNAVPTNHRPAVVASPSSSTTYSPSTLAPGETPESSAQRNPPTTASKNSGANDPIPTSSKPPTHTSILKPPNSESLSATSTQEEPPLPEKGSRSKEKKELLPKDLSDDDDDDQRYVQKEPEDGKNGDGDLEDEQDLPNLHEHLRLVRAEAKWTVRVIRLLAEERRLLRKIAGAGGGRRLG